MTTNRINRMTTIATFTVAALCSASPVLALGHDELDVPEATAPTIEVPTVETPSELDAKVPASRTPDVSTPAAATPGEHAGVSVPASDLPTQATVELRGAVDGQVETPASTPGIDQSAAVPAVAVDEQTVRGIEVPSQSVSASVPGHLTASDSGMSADAANAAGAAGSWEGEGSFDVAVDAADRTLTVGVG